MIWAQWNFRTMIASVAAICCFLITVSSVRAAGRSPFAGQRTRETAIQPKTGEKIYRDMCVKCHGANGEGVAGKYDEPLYGDRSIKALTRLIDRTMPEDDPDKVNGEDAAKVAEYIYDAFYSPAARAKFRPARIELSRLTVRQYLNTVADLIGSFRTGQQIGDERGLSGQYYNARNFRGEKKVIERVDPRIEFNFGEATPDPEKLTTNEFAIRWRGSVIAEDTGDYEFCLKTENGARLWVNTTNEGRDSKAFIDGWVSSGREPREEKATIRLIGGRAYPIQVDYFKFKDKTASLILKWKPPHKTWEIIPERNLTPARVPETMVVTTAFPPDDSSVGYERGTSISKAWHQATTYAAIEVASKVLEQLNALAGTKADADDREARVKMFCEQFAKRAFRRPLDPAQKEFFIEKQFKDAPDLDAAVKQSVLLVLKSPRFLYPELGVSTPDDYGVASRLSLSLWDSLPDKELLQAAEGGKLRASDQISAQARRMLKDSRAKSKLRDFFHHWLEMEEAEDISKDPGTFPDFNDTVLSDLRTSLDLFIDEVIWSEKSDYRELLRADYLFVNSRLAKLYGGDVSSEHAFEKVSYNPGQRAGIVTHPYLLSAFAYHKSSSPIHRGVFLTRNVVGRSLKPPPMAIEFMDGRFDPSLTMREKVAELTRPAACQTCHSVINPLGFSLEHYDAVGRYRTTDNKKPVDATSEYTTTSGDTIKLTGARDLAEYAVKTEEAHRGFVRQLFQQLVKQSPDAYGSDTLEKLRRSFAASEFNIQKLVAEIASLTALQNSAPQQTQTPTKPANKRDS